MADRILTYRQSSVVQDIEQYLRLLKVGAPEETLREVLDGIVLLVEEDTHLPTKLKVSRWFAGRTVFSTRGTRASIRVWLHELHEHYDRVGERGLPG